MEEAVSKDMPRNNVVRPPFSTRASTVRGAPPDRLQRLVETLQRDGRKLRAMELLLGVRGAQVVSVEVPSCATLVSVATDVDRILRRVQRTGYRQMNLRLIAAARGIEDSLVEVVDALSTQAATLAAAAAVDSDVLIDPLVRRRLREIVAEPSTDATAAAGGPPSGAAASQG